MVLDLSVKKAGANCWVEGTDGTSRFQEERAVARKGSLSAMLWRSQSHVRSWEELGLVATATGRWSEMFGRG